MQPSMALEKELESIIARVKEEGGSELLIEHLQTAAAYRHGAMPDECAHNLELARGAADSISSKSLEQDVRHTIEGVLHELHPPAHTHWRHHASFESHVPPPTAVGLAEFFQGADLSLGMFYPRKHVIAVFPSFHDAQFAHYLLCSSGFRGWEAIAVPGYQFDEFLSRIRGKQSFWAHFATHISRFLDTEAGRTDRYVKLAQRGASFVAAYSPTQEQAEGIREILSPLHPLAMHWFMAGYIRDLL